MLSEEDVAVVRLRWPGIDGVAWDISDSQLNNPNSFMPWLTYSLPLSRDLDILFSSVLLTDLCGQPP